MNMYVPSGDMHQSLSAHLL